MNSSWEIKGKENSFSKELFYTKHKSSHVVGDLSDSTKKGEDAEHRP